MADQPTLPRDQLDDRIAILRDNISQLTEQAAAVSGAGTEALLADRISSQQEELDRLVRQRDDLVARMGNAPATAAPAKAAPKAAAKKKPAMKKSPKTAPKKKAAKKTAKRSASKKKAAKKRPAKRKAAKKVIAKKKSAKKARKAKRR